MMQFAPKFTHLSHGVLLQKPFSSSKPKVKFQVSFFIIKTFPTRIWFQLKWIEMCNSYKNSCIDGVLKGLWSKIFLVRFLV